MEQSDGTNEIEKIKVIKNMINNLEKDLLNQLKTEVKWLDDVTHLGGVIPRLFALQGEVKENGEYPLYRHPMDQHIHVESFSPTVLRIKERIEHLLGQTFNHCIIQLYKDGKDFIGPHADKSIDIIHDSVIVNYSVGADRIMKFRSKRPLLETDKKYDIHTFTLENNSLLVMPLSVNKYYTHEITKNSLIDDERISITFRNIGTFYNPITNIIRGLGAQKETKHKTSKKELLISFQKENKTHASYDELYSNGFGYLTINEDYDENYMELSDLFF